MRAHECLRFARDYWLLKIGVALITLFAAFVAATPSVYAADTIVSGKITNAANQAVSGASITFTEEDSTTPLIASVTTDSEGSYTTMLTSNKFYTIHIVPPEGSGLLTTTYTKHQVLSGIKTMNATLQTTSHTVMGTVQDKFGVVLPNQTIGIRDKNGYIATTTTNANGFYSVSAPAFNNYSLEMTGSRSVPEAFVPTQFVRNELLNLTNDVTKDILVEAVQLVVSVREPSGAVPVSPASIYITSSKTTAGFPSPISVGWIAPYGISYDASVQTNANGDATIMHMANSTYHLSIHGSSLDGYGNIIVGPNTIGDTDSLLNVTIPTSRHTISGTINRRSTRTGQVEPLTGLDVRITNLTRYRNLTTVTDNDGHYSLTVPTDSSNGVYYRLFLTQTNTTDMQASLPGNLTSYLNVDMSADRAGDITFSIDSINFTVHDSLSQQMATDIRINGNGNGSLTAPFVGAGDITTSFTSSFTSGPLVAKPVYVRELIHGLTYSITFSGVPNSAYGSVTSNGFQPDVDASLQVNIPNYVPAPTNLTSTTPGVGYPSFTWNYPSLAAPYSADHYVIYQDNTPIGTTKDKSYTDLTATNIGTRTYQVSAVNAQGTEGPRTPILTIRYTLPDSIPPIVTGTPDRQPDGANGWYDDDVTITWHATDSSPSSGAPTQPPDTIANQEGTHVYTSEPSCDPAGNCATGQLSLKIDKSVPTITYSLSQEPNDAGWNNTPVKVTFHCTDAGDLAECTPPVTITTEGATTVTGTARDAAGKVATVSVPIKIDTISPTITFTAASNGWVNTPDGVAYQCKNEDGSSSTHTAPIVTNPDGTTTATGSCTDPAGNTTDQTIPVQVDATEPELTPVLSEPVNELGWSTGPVTVTFQCSDPGTADTASGIASCTEPVTVTEQGTTVVRGIAIDRAGNTTEVEVFVKIDSVKPTLDYTISPAAPDGENGWYTSDITVTFSCSDETSGVASCPQTRTITTDGAQNITATAVDKAGNQQTATIPLKLDKTVPTVGAPTWSANPVASGQATTVTVSAADTVSGVRRVEYFLGDTDPGVGNGTAMASEGSSFAATFGSNLATGVHKITLRAQDNAGNWSVVSQDYLVIYNPSGYRMTGKHAVAPSLAAGDILPGLIADNQDETATFAFNVRYNEQGSINSESDLRFSYRTGRHCNNPAKAENCHSLELNATTIAWLTTQGENDNTGIFQGTAVITVDGTTSTVTFRVTGQDGNRLTPATSDTFQIQIFNLADNPNIAQPIYVLHSTPIDAGKIRII